MEIKFTRPLNGLAASLKGMVDVTETGEDWLRYRTTAPEQTNPAVLNKLVGGGVDVVTLSEVPRSLEAVYLQIVTEDEGASRA